MGATIAVECEPRMAPLLRRAFPTFTVVPREDPPAPVLTDEDSSHETADRCDGVGSNVGGAIDLGEYECTAQGAACDGFAVVGTGVFHPHVHSSRLSPGLPVCTPRI